MTKNPYFSLLTHIKKLLLVTYCDMTAETGVSFQTHGRKDTTRQYIQQSLANMSLDEALIAGYLKEHGPTQTLQPSIPHRDTPRPRKKLRHVEVTPPKILTKGSLPSIAVSIPPPADTVKMTYTKPEVCHILKDSKKGSPA